MTATPYLIGYARTSTRSQDLTIQRDALNKAGCAKIFEEQESGAKRNRPQLDAALDQLRPGDVFCVWKVDRLARSLSHLLAIVENLKARQIHFRSLTENFDTTTASGEAFFQICGVMAQLERKLIEERREAGLQKARDAGKKFGRKLASDPTSKQGEKRAGALAMAMQAAQGGKSVRSAASEFGVSRATLTRHLSRVLSNSDLSIVLTPKRQRKQASAAHLNGYAH